MQIAGPDVLSYGEMLDLMADALGVRRRPRVPVPLITPWLSSLWIGLVTQVDAGVARPLVEGLSTPTTVTDSSGAELFDVHTRCPSWTRSARHSTRITSRRPGGVSAHPLRAVCGSDGSGTSSARRPRAFAQAAEGDAEEGRSDKKLLTSILTYHVVKGAVPVSRVVKLDRKSVKTLDGKTVKIRVSGSEVYVNTRKRPRPRAPRA